MTKYPIKDFYGRIKGWIEEDTNGDAIGKDFYGRILGRYDKGKNLTKDFYGRVVGTGNLLTALMQIK